MGLDVFHLTANDRGEGYWQPLDRFPDLQQSLAPYVRDNIVLDVDFAKLLGQRGYDLNDYHFFQGGIGRNSLGGYFSRLTFNRRGTPDTITSRSLVFEEKPKILNIVSTVLHALSNRPRTYYGTFPSMELKQTGVYAQRTGYQRNCMVPAFYEQFPPDFVSSDIALLRSMADLVEPAAQGDFHRNFLDCWEDGRSFLIVSW